MASPSVSRFNMLVSIFLLLITFFDHGLVSAATDNHVHHLPYPKLHSFARRNATASGNMTLEAARLLLAQGQAAMALANARILENPRSNNYTVLNSTELEKTREPAPLLDYTNSTAATLRRRQLAGNGTADGNSTATLSYTVPPELAEAARIVAEASPPSTDRSEYTALLETVKAKFLPPVSDTNVMPPVLKRPSGLLEVVREAPSVYRFAGNASDVAVASPHIEKRDGNSWWMANIQQRGSSPFAPAGYKVSRNVKDYGAKGGLPRNLELESLRTFKADET